MICVVIFGQEFGKNLLSYLKSAPSSFAQLESFYQKTEMPTFGTKNTLFEYFLG